MKVLASSSEKLGTFSGRLAEAMASLRKGLSCELDSRKTVDSGGATWNKRPRAAIPPILF